MINGVIKSNNNNVRFFMRFLSSSFLDGVSKVVGKPIIAMCDSCGPFVAHLSNQVNFPTLLIEYNFISLFA